jgi:hypothetical protein
MLILVADLFPSLTDGRDSKVVPSKLHRGSFTEHPIPFMKYTVPGELRDVATLGYIWEEKKKKKGGFRISEHFPDDLLSNTSTPSRQLLGEMKGLL